MSKFLITIVACSIFCSLLDTSTLSYASESEVENEALFTYINGTGNGPKDWGSLNQEWKVCGDGEMQSPVDLRDMKPIVSPSLGKLKRDYESAPAIVKNRGHDVTVEWKADAGQININNTYYKLKRCHWHTPSEHIINRTRYDMELHVIHESRDGKIAVIAILYKHGRPDPFLAKLLGHVNSLGKEERHAGIVNPGNIKFGSRKYYRYIGSLTVPPCTEGIVWTISHKVRTVSREQVRALRDVVHDGFETNARPIQKLNGRAIWLYNGS